MLTSSPQRGAVMSNRLTNADEPITPIDGLGTGLSKREYFAVHADQPGVAEIALAAGLHCPDGFTLWSDERTKIGGFNEWWAKLPGARRLELWAQVRVAQADALLTALEAKS